MKIQIPKDDLARLLSAQPEELDYRELYRAYSPTGRKSVAEPRLSWGHGLRVICAGFTRHESWRKPAVKEWILYGCYKMSRYRIAARLPDFWRRDTQIFLPNYIYCVLATTYESRVQNATPDACKRTFQLPEKSVFPKSRKQVILSCWHETSVLFQTFCTVLFQTFCTYVLFKNFLHICIDRRVKMC